MRSKLRIVSAALALTLMGSAAWAQRPRISDTATTSEDTKTAEAPLSVKAKYEGGVFGYNQKQDGTLTFDDVNQRLLFTNKYQKEVLFIPYSAVTSTFGDTQARRPTAATIISQSVPYGLGLPALFIKKKYQYLTLQYDDQTTRVSGITSFKLENKETLAMTVTALAGKAGLTQRGEIFVRERPDNSKRSAMNVRLISGGTLNDKAVALPRPEYPKDARDAKVSGTVTVAVVVDEDGSVNEAEAVSGPILLRSAAIEAALKAKFTPVKVDGYPAKVTGTLTYDFQ
jgi:TonB family protein